MRRHLGPVSRAEAFEKLCEVRGVKLQQGSRNDRTSVTVSEVAAELGVDTRTARRRLRLAKDLNGYDDLRQKVDSGEMEAKRVLRSQDVPWRCLGPGFRVLHF